MSESIQVTGRVTGARPRVGLFVTCLVDAIRPSIGFAAIKLLEDAGCNVDVPGTQTCCGQPGFNSGADDHAREIARQVIAAFEQFDYVVVPSGSCAGMIRVHYADLFTQDPAWAERHRKLAERPTRSRVSLPTSWSIRRTACATTV